jgi:hypothetical protein
MEKGIIWQLLLDACQRLGSSLENLVFIKVMFSIHAAESEPYRVTWLSLSRQSPYSEITR